MAEIYKITEEQIAKNRLKRRYVGPDRKVIPYGGFIQNRQSILRKLGDRLVSGNVQNIFYMRRDVRYGHYSAVSRIIKAGDQLVPIELNAWEKAQIIFDATKGMYESR